MGNKEKTEVGDEVEKGVKRIFRKVYITFQPHSIHKIPPGLPVHITTDSSIKGRDRQTKILKILNF